MKRYTILLAGLIALTFAACNPKNNREAALREIETADSILSVSVNRMAVDMDQAAHIVDLYTQFADQFPEDSLTPGFLHKAGDIAAHIGQEDNAVVIYDRILSDYTDYPALAEICFNKAWTLEQGQRYAEAKEAFQQFVDQYPEHPLAKDIRFMLEQNLIGLSVEEQYNAIIGNNE